MGSDGNREAFINPAGLVYGGSCGNCARLAQASHLSTDSKEQLLDFQGVQLTFPLGTCS